VKKWKVDIDDLRIIFVVLYFRNLPLEARVVFLAHIIQKQPLEGPLGVEDAQDALSFDDLEVNELPNEGFFADSVL
jgi:hypothetical protein